MIVDSSALIAILRAEPAAAIMVGALVEAANPRLSAADFVEVGAVIDGSSDPVAGRRYDELLVVVRITIVSVTETQARLARQAYRDFGKGSGHPARLNFGDCFAYALAKGLHEPLLFTGTISAVPTSSPRDEPGADAQPLIGRKRRHLTAVLTGVHGGPVRCHGSNTSDPVEAIPA